MKLSIEEIMRNAGKQSAESLQNAAPSMSSTELYDNAEDIPWFKAAVKNSNMLIRAAGFVCKSSSGRVVRLIQPYDSEIFTQEPEELSAQWGFAWSKNPKDALPFIKIATSPYMIGDCCTENGYIYVSKNDNNVFSPSEYPLFWDLVVSDLDDIQKGGDR